MKRGFTLIEIIVSIAIIALIGVGSFVGVRYINERIRINKLSQITDKAIMAADVWIESNKEASNQLYSERNAVFVPLTHLVNDGLLSLDNTDLTLDNIKGEYVIKALSGEGKDTSCDEIKTVTSWDKSNPLYICTHLNNDGSTSSNIAMIKQDELSNMNKASREPYYFRGSYPNNYAKINGNDYRIVSVGTDDRIEIIKGEYNYTFNDITYKGTVYNSLNYPRFIIYGSLNNELIVGCYSNCGTEDIKLIKKITISDIINTVGNNDNPEIAISGWGYSRVYSLYGPQSSLENRYYSGNLYFYQLSGTNFSAYSTVTLNSCMKITSGSGTSDNPYIIEPKKCS